jgi:hypothetical protein
LIHAAGHLVPRFLVHPEIGFRSACDRVQGELPRRHFLAFGKSMVGSFRQHRPSMRRGQLCGENCQDTVARICERRRSRLKCWFELMRSRYASGQTRVPRGWRSVDAAPQRSRCVLHRSMRGCSLEGPARKLGKPCVRPAPWRAGYGAFGESMRRRCVAGFPISTSQLPALHRAVAMFFWKLVGLDLSVAADQDREFPVEPSFDDAAESALPNIGIPYVPTVTFCV